MLAMEHTKIRPSFEGCYSYDKLKSEGLVDEETLDDEIIRIHTAHNDASRQKPLFVVESSCSHIQSNDTCF